MRRFRPAHEHCLPDENVLALWKCDENDNTTLADSAYSASFALSSVGTTRKMAPLFDGEASIAAGLGAVRTDNTTGSPGWYQQAAAGSSVAKDAVVTDWSLSMWALPPASTTVALFEYSSEESPASSANLMAIGVYRLANGKIRAQWDVSASVLARSVDFNVDLSAAAGHHIGLRRDYYGPDNKPTGSTATARLSLFIDGELTESQFLRSALTGPSNSRFVLGASRRWGTGSGASPAFTQGVTFDDVVFFKTAIPDGKFRDLYRNGVRSWDEARMFESGGHRSEARVLIEDGDGAMVDMSRLYGVNWVRSVDYKTDVDTPAATASFELTTRVGSSLSLSPLAETSALNLNASGAFEALLELRRRVRIEVATVPNEWRIQGFEYETLFEGYIDNVSFTAETISVDCVDRMVELADVFQLDPKAYDYYDVETLAETHMQSVISDNSPRLYAGDATLTFAWLGGATPLLYTPASSGWVLRYDDTPAANVDGLLQSVSDQIGWDLRWKFHVPTHQHRLTFYEPPRDMVLDIKAINDGADGTTEVVMTTPHGLVEGQTITIAGTSAFNGTTTVLDVMNHERVKTAQVIGVPAATENVGTVTYASCLTIPDTLIKSIEPVKKSAEDIRNACVVRYGRDSAHERELETLVTVSGGSGSPLTVVMSNANKAAYLKFLAAGQTFSLVSPSETDINGDYTISSITSGGDLVTSQTVAAAVTLSSDVVLTTTYLPFKSEFSCSTVSIARYGLRNTGIFEESSGNIDTAAEALRLASAVVSDLAFPTVDMSIRLCCAPWIELHDVVSIPADAKGRWSAQQDVAVVSVAHRLAGSESYSTIGLRDASPTRGRAWPKRMEIGPGKPARPNVLDESLTAANLLPYYDLGSGVNVGTRVKPHYGIFSTSPRKALRHDMTEIHASTQADFAVTADTLVATSRGNEVKTTMLADGTALPAGTPVFFRVRARDVFGNVTLPSPATSMVARYTDVAPAARAFRVSTASCTFRTTGWCAYPFNNDSSSPGFDRYGNYTLGRDGGGSTVTLPLVANPPTEGFFRMPCDGVVSVSAHLGVWNSDSGSNQLEEGNVVVGLLRVGSNIPGSNASTPFFQFTGVAQNRSAITGPDVYPNPDHGYCYPVIDIAGGAGEAVFFDFSTQTSAHSGDYIVPAVKVMSTFSGVTDLGKATGISPVLAGTTGSASASWVRFSVQQD